ncbi:MAG: hypothetical protein ACLFPD_04035 [Desulfosudaceae bacterium]
MAIVIVVTCLQGDRATPVPIINNKLILNGYIPARGGRPVTCPADKNIFVMKRMKKYIYVKMSEMLMIWPGSTRRARPWQGPGGWGCFPLSVRRPACTGSAGKIPVAFSGKDDYHQNYKNE